MRKLWPLLALCGVASAANIRVLIISGANNHDWRTTTPHLRALLSKTGRFDVRVTEEPWGISAEGLAQYDALVLDYNGPRWSAGAEQAVERFVRSGKGLVVVHGASYAFGDMEILGDKHVRTGIREPAWAAYAAMTGASWSDDAPKSGHAPRHIFEVKVSDAEHPVTKGLGGGSLQTSDELYHNLRLKDGIHVLACASDDRSIGGTGKDEPVLWTLAYGHGRVFHTVLGHDVAAMSEPVFTGSFVRGVEWAATGDVRSTPLAEETGLRVLVVTGGHDHEASFYTMLDAIGSGLRINVNPHPAAYNGDLRKQYDVLVLYDLVDTVPEAQKKNLRDFVEGGGKGVVALHHSIADFNGWPWWYQEVIGGRYLLKADGSQPASSYRHDEEIRVTSVADHPIVRGLPPLHLWDETYKQMWISPKVNVLLRTDNPTSDGPVAWVSPYDRARVVYVELGHGRVSHEHPGYRQLVRNAILWAGGKLD